MRLKKKRLFLFLFIFYFHQTGSVSRTNSLSPFSITNKRNSLNKNDPNDIPEGSEQETSDYGMLGNSQILSGKSMKNYEMRELSSLRGYPKDDEDDFSSDSSLNSAQSSSLSNDQEPSFSENFPVSRNPTQSNLVREHSSDTINGLRAASYSELPPLKKDSICTSDTNSPQCYCIESCAPNSVYSYEPCQCLEIAEARMVADNLSSSSSSEAGNEPTELPSHSTSYTQPPIPSNQIQTFSMTSQKNDQTPEKPLDISVSSSNFVQDFCSYPENYFQSDCLCKRSCLGREPMSNPPCRCSESATHETSTLPSSSVNSYLSGNDNSYGPSFFLNMVSELNERKMDIPAIDNSKLEPSPNAWTLLNQDKSAEINIGCDKSCYPYSVYSYSPCSCKFEIPQMTASQRSNFSYSPLWEGAQNYYNYNPSFSPYPNLIGFGNMDSTFMSQPSSYNRMYGQTPQLPSRIPEYRSKYYSKPKTEHVPKVSPKFLYLGCFRDKKNPGRDLKLHASVSNLTPHKCVDKCKTLHKRFAAVQYGYLCFCGSRFGRYGRVEDEKCSTTCMGDPQQKCGGVWLNSIYSTDGQRYHEKQFSFTTPDPSDEIQSTNPKPSRSKKIKTTKKAPPKVASKPSKSSKPRSKTKKAVKGEKHFQTKNKTKPVREANISNPDITTINNISKDSDDLVKYLAKEMMQFSNQSSLNPPSSHEVKTKIKKENSRRKDVSRFIHHHFSTAGHKMDEISNLTKFRSDSSNISYKHDSDTVNKNTSKVLPFNNVGKDDGNSALKSGNETDEFKKRNHIHSERESEEDYDDEDEIQTTNSTELQNIGHKVFNDTSIRKNSSLKVPKQISNINLKGPSTSKKQGTKEKIVNFKKKLSKTLSKTQLKKSHKKKEYREDEEQDYESPDEPIDNDDGNDEIEDDAEEDDSKNGKRSKIKRLSTKSKAKKDGMQRKRT